LREGPARAGPHGGAAFRRPIQRIGLSATQRPLEEVARFLGGAEARRVRKTRVEKAPPPRRKTLLPVEDVESDLHQEFSDDRSPATYRQVTIIDASEKKALALRIEVPVEDMARLAQPIELPSGPAAQGPVRPSIW